MNGYYEAEYEHKLTSLREEVKLMEKLGRQRYAKRKVFEVCTGIRTQGLLQDIKMLKREFQASQAKCYRIGGLRYSDIHRLHWQTPILHSIPREDVLVEDAFAHGRGFQTESNGDRDRLRDIYSRQEPNSCESSKTFSAANSEIVGTFSPASRLCSKPFAHRTLFIPEGTDAMAESDANGKSIGLAPKPAYQSVSNEA